MTGTGGVLIVYSLLSVFWLSILPGVRSCGCRQKGLAFPLGLFVDSFRFLDYQKKKKKLKPRRKKRTGSGFFSAILFLLLLLWPIRTSVSSHLILSLSFFAFVLGFKTQNSSFGWGPLCGRLVFFRINTDTNQPTIVTDTYERNANTLARTTIPAGAY